MWLRRFGDASRSWRRTPRKASGPGGWWSGPAEKTTRTLADGLRTQSLGERNFAVIVRFVDGMVTVTEAEIRAALKLYLGATGIVAEPSGAVTLAAALFHAGELPKAAKMVVVVSGGNLEPELREKLVAEMQNEPGTSHV